MKRDFTTVLTRVFKPRRFHVDCPKCGETHEVPQYRAPDVLANNKNTMECRDCKRSRFSFE